MQIERQIDKGETLEECASREVMEETGLKNIKPGKKIVTTYHTYDEYGKHILKESHWYKMKIREDQKLIPQTEEDITEIKWVKKKDLPKYLNNSFGTIRQVLKDI